MSSSTDAPPSTAYLALCIAGVWLTWTAHDYLQERIFRAPGFHFGLFMAFALQFVAFLLSLAYRVGVWAFDDGREQMRRCAEEEKRRRLAAAAAEEEEQGETLLLDGDDGEGGAERSNNASSLLSAHDPVKELAHVASAASSDASSSEATLSTFGWYLALSLLIAAANGSATAALNFVNMQTKVLFKSAKIVTVMLLGKLCFGKSYAAMEYGYMLNVVLGLVAFLLASKGGALASSLPGLLLLALAVLSDSLVPNVQQRLLTTLRRPKHELVFHTNWVSALLTACYTATTGEGAAALAFLRRRPYLSLLLLVQSVCGYLGILVYLETVRAFGPKVTVVVTSCRKLFTIGLSSVLFRHPLNGFHVLGVSAVFGGVLWNANSDLRCSRLLAPVSLLAVALIVALELKLDQSLQLSDEWRAQLGLETLRALLRTSVLN